MQVDSILTVLDVPGLVSWSAASGWVHTLAPALSPEDIMDMLGQQRRRVLKRVPKASRIPAAEKLAEMLLQAGASTQGGVEEVASKLS